MTAKGKNYFIPLIFITILISVFLYLFLNTSLFKKSKKVKYIAFIGRYTPSKDQKIPKFDKMHEVALEEYVSRISHPEVKFELKTFSCRNDGTVSDSIYKDIAKDTNIVAVIDNTWGKHIKLCSKTIRENKIPVIAINADRNHVDFGDNVVFIGNDDNVPNDIAAFTKKILHLKKINFISEEDYDLHHNYLKTFEKDGIEINKMFTVRSKEFVKDSAGFYDAISQYYKSDPSAQEMLTVISVHAPIGNNLLSYLNKNFNKLYILGHAYNIDTDRFKKFGENSDNRMIIITKPTDAVTKDLYLDVEQLKLNYPEYMDINNHHMFVTRCFDAVEVLRSKFELADKYDTMIDYGVSKASFINYFQSLKNKTILKNNRMYELDSALNVLPDVYFAEFSSGKLHSYPLQLNERREVIPNLFFGMEIVDIYNIDMNANSFTSDFYYWLKLDSSNQEAEKYIIFQNMKQNESSKELIFEKKYGSTVYKLYKVSGIFFVNFELTDYPFDRQEIFIRAQILNPSDKLKISFDQKSFDLGDNAIEKFKITEWNKLKYYVTVDNEIQRGMHGDPDIEEERLNEFKNIYFRLNLKRKTLSPMLEIILPALLIGIVSLALLFMRDVSFDNLGEVSIGIFMAIVAFSISYSAATPSSDHLTKADYIFWLTFIVVLMNFMVVVVLNAVFGEDKVKTMDIRKFSTFISIGYVLIVGYVLLG